LRARIDAVAGQVQFKGQQHILKRGERGNELIGLKDEAQLLAAHGGERFFFQIVNRRAVEPDLAFAGRVEAGKQAEQRALAAAAGADDGHKLARGMLMSIPLRISTRLEPF
jgi:hypothetical protein